MTYDECKELLSILMDAVVKQVDARLFSAVKFEGGVVRLVDNDNIYVRPSSDVSTPTHSSPTSTAQLDDGDIVLPNISGISLEAGDGVEILYTTTVDNGVIVRKMQYASVNNTQYAKNITVKKANGETGFYANRSDTGVEVGLLVGTDGVNHGVYSKTDDRWIIYNDENGDTRIQSPMRLSDALYIEGHTSEVGTVQGSTLSADKSISSDTATNVTSLSLDAGVWIIIGRVRFSANATGYRRANILSLNESTSAHIQATAVDGAVTQLSLAKIVTPTVTTTYYLNAYQNSGSTLTLPAGGSGEINAMTAVRIA